MHKLKNFVWDAFPSVLRLLNHSQCNTSFLHEASDVKSSRWPASKEEIYLHLQQLKLPTALKQSCPNMNEPFPLIWINVFQPNPKESLISQWKQIVSDIKRWNENVLSPRIQMTLCAAVETSTSKESTAAVTVKNLMMPVKGYSEESQTSQTSSLVSSLIWLIVWVCHVVP